MEDHHIIKDIDAKIKEKRKMMRAVKKELDKLKEMKKNILRDNSPEIRKIAREIQKLANNRNIPTKEVLDMVASAIEKYPYKKRGAPRGRTIPPKFVNPDNPQETWTGRGRQPLWFKKALEKYSFDDLKIDKSLETEAVQTKASHVS